MFCFFFNDTTTTQIYTYLHTLPLHDALPISNCGTHIDVIQRGADAWHYRLRPVTWRKNQLRVHMAALGAPIVGDDVYPALSANAGANDFSRPLKLLARGLSFVDPLSGRRREFMSMRAL